MRPNATTVLLFLTIVLGLLVARSIGSRQPGPVKIARIDNATGNDRFQAEAVVASIESYLARVALLPPPDAPGAGVNEFVSVVEASPVRKLSWVVKLYALLKRLVLNNSGHFVTAKALESGLSCGLTLRIGRLPNETVESVHTFWAANFQQLAERSAALIYHHVVNHPPVARRTPTWARWTADEGSSFLHHQNGVRLNELGLKDQAGSELLKAIELEPGNAQVRLRLADLYESRHEYVQAIRLYLNILDVWPDIIAARYRLIGVCNNARKQLKQWNPEDLEVLAKLLKRGSLVPGTCSPE